VVAGLALALGSVPLASVEVLAVPAAEGPVAEAARVLAHGSVEQRLRAVRRLTSWCYGESTHLLADALLGDPDARVRAAAATGLGRHAQSGSVGALLKAASDRHDEARVRKAAVDALGSVRHPKAVEALLAFVGDEEPGIRWLAVKGLGRVVTAPDAKLLDTLGGALREDPEAVNRRMAATVLHGLGCDEADALLRTALANEPSPSVRKHLARLLADGEEVGAEGPGAAEGAVRSLPTTG
jgi:hypothetical protein